MKKVILLCTSLIIMACTGNERAKYWGGTHVINVKKGQKVIEATWKGNELWYLTENMDSDYIPKEKIFQEESSWGIIEGNVIFKESK